MKLKTGSFMIRISEICSDNLAFRLLYTFQKFKNQNINTVDQLNSRQLYFEINLPQTNVRDQALSRPVFLL